MVQLRRILITGSRDWVERTTVWNALNQELQTFEALTIVHGGARGADNIADRWAWGMSQQGYNVVIEEHKANWERDGKRAGVLRNQEMVNLGADVCHAFPLGKSVGTRHCMARAMSAGIPVVNHGFEPFTKQAQEFVEAYG
ncbi:hypothetical protein KIV66_gp63 [Mycobacterium phage MyraDee]|uniref:YspA cpYpsA-related SLOG domain-containing protein n=1 Tax=Mycobacterium phage MyraDee TaxID=2024303 RepID=A0A222YZE8_9CAUD|nr:hypothetical protein KIV66_gp63 [Mycobacterium phage MyraDee]ASR77170.1 hypothetical protein SEA_MYRADEE_63 [Mycobacterium phage MyraDee]